ncbi:hypothetical protein CCMA1212_000199 [Trichoderma ghanense]|uniref:Uncharacterized protein n=1 Tax=Trichoderma ghanense TaxID=65468 RepID=A0ABY2HFX7_9HYPO
MLRQKQKKQQYGKVARASWISAPLCMSQNSPHGKYVPNAASHVRIWSTATV